MKKRNSLRLIIFFLGLILFLIDISYNLYRIYYERKEINKFFSNNQKLNINPITKNDEYIGIIEIEKIKLKKGFYNIDSVNNSVSKGIQVIEKSDMPDVENSTLILASHSGNSKVSYFKKLFNLEVNDTINIYYNNKKYTYTLIDIYEIDKTGTLTYEKKTNNNILILITCLKTDDSKQKVYVSKLVSE